MLKKESELLYIFGRRPWSTYTESELKQQYKKKSKSYVESFLKKYREENILITERKGNQVIYSINLASAKARSVSGTVLEFIAWKKLGRISKELEETIKKIPHNNYISLITGSYAKRTQTEKSDIDLVILIEDTCKPSKVKAALSMQCELSIPHIHLYVFTNSEFIQMLKDSEPNYGKEIAKNCLVLTQGQTYLKLVWEAIKNGFNDKTLD